MAATTAPGTTTEIVDLTQELVTSYESFYRSDQADVYDGNYLGLMNAFKVAGTVQGAESVANERRELLSGILQTRELPQAVVTLLPSDHKLLLVHRLYYFPKPMGNNEAKDWEEKVVGFVGDVMGTQLPQAVMLDVEVFGALPAAVRVLKTIAVRVAMENNPTMDNFPPVSDLVLPENYDEVRTRYAMCVPPKYVNVLMGRRLTPREGFLEIERAVRENNDEEAMQPLLDWLRIAVTRGGVETTANSRVTLTHSPGVPMVTPELADKLQRLVRGDLPAWQKETPTPQGVILPAASAQQMQLEQLLLAQLLKQQGPGINEDAEKPPSAHFKGTINLLLRLTNRTEEKELPEIYHRWANSNKKEFRAVLQEVFDQNAVRLGLPEPVATADLAMTISTLRFASADEDDLEQGLQPFAVSYHSQKTLAEQSALNSLHDLLYLGTPQLTDLWAMKAANKLWIPTKLSQLVRTLKSFAVVLATVIGTEALLYQCYKAQIVDAFDEVSPTLETYAERHPGQPVYAQIVRWLQLRFNEYWRQAQRNVGGPGNVPDFTTLYTAIKFKNWLPPEIPFMYLRESEPMWVGGQIPTSTRGGGALASVGGPATSGSGVAVQTIGDGKRSAPKSIKNEEVPDTIRGLSANIGKIQKFLEVMGDGQPPQIPKNNKGQEMCLSWYLKGNCYSTCQRKDSHAKLNPAEEKRLSDFIKRGLAKQQATQTSGAGATE